MTDHFLMCAPDHFEVAYVINPWMKGNVALGDSDAAQRQWHDLAKLIGTVAQVERLAPAAGLPDMVFTANAGLVFENKFVLSHFRHAERQGEEAHSAQWFAQHGYEVVTLPPDIWFEGAGDALLDRQLDLLWLGHGHRSHLASAPLLAGLLNIEVEPLQLINEHFYHLDTCFCPLAGGYLMYYPAAFDAASQSRIAARIPQDKHIVVSDADAHHFACNAVNCGQNIFLNQASAALVSQLQACGFSVQQTALTEFMKAGGSAKCLTLKLNEARRTGERS